MSFWVIDAKIATRTALELDDALRDFWASLAHLEITRCAPRLWVSETTFALRALAAQKLITDEEAEQVLRTIHRLRIEIMDEDEALCLLALELAGELDQSKAYDGLSAEFWIADERLANRAKDLNLAWVRWVGRA